MINRPRADVAVLPCTLGNAATARLARYLQMKSELTVGAPGDRYEREADAVADRVMAMPEPAVQRQDLEEETPEVQAQVEEEEEPVQAQVEEEEEEPEVQAKSDTTPVVTPRVKAELEATRGSGAPLSRNVRAFMEPRLGRDLSSVRVHTGGGAAGLARQLRAQAFTRGADVYFASGKYAPETAAGKRLLAHELAHVGQQTRGRKGLRKVPVIRRKVDPKKVSCGRLTRTASGRKRLKKLIGTTNPVGEIQAADGQAIRMLDKVIKELRRVQRLARRAPASTIPWTRTISFNHKLANLMRACFNMEAWDKKVWTSRRHMTRKGKIRRGETLFKQSIRKPSPTVTLLLKRLGSLRSILNGGWIWYTCVGGRCHKVRTRAYAYYRRYRIYFCGRLWKTMKPADQRGLVLIHEAFHIYYGGTDRYFGIWSAWAIHRFVGDFNGVKRISKDPWK